MDGIRRKETAAIAGVLLAMAALALAAEYLFADIPPGPALPNGALTAAEAKAIDVALSLCQSFITWSIAVIGGVAILLKLNVQEKITYPRQQVLFASVVIILAVISIFCGHLGIDLTQRALALQQFPLRIAAVHLSFRWQYLTALGAIASFGAFSLSYFLEKASQVRAPDILEGDGG